MGRWIDIPETPVDVADVSHMPLRGYTERGYKLYAIDVTDDGCILVHYRFKVVCDDTCEDKSDHNHEHGHSWFRRVDFCSQDIKEMVARELSK